MLKIISLALVVVGSIMLIANYWNDLGNLINQEAGNENKFIFIGKLGLFLFTAGCVCGLINIIFY